MIKTMKLEELHAKYATVFLNTQTNKNYQQKFDEKLKNDFEIHKNHGNNKFTLLWPKGVYPDKYMDNSGKLNETFTVT